MTTDLDARLRALDPLADETFDESAADEALLTSVLAEPFVRRKSHRLLAAAAALVLIAGLAVAVTVFADDSDPSIPTAGPSAGAVAIDIEPVSFTQRKSGAVVARINDPYAAADELTAAFKRQGLDIRVSAIPGSPSTVGTIVFSDFDAEPIRARGCTTASGAACQIGFVVPSDFKGHGEAAVGRPARPGEEYSTSNGAFAAKEALHCSGIYGKRAQSPAVADVLTERGLVAEWSVRGKSVGGASGGIQVYENGRLPAGSPPPEGYVRAATPLDAKRVLIHVGDAPSSTDVARVNRGC